MFLHIMVGQNPKKTNGKETTLFYFVWRDLEVDLCQKNIRHGVLKKWKYI
jgi:hypothetical protein